MTVLTKEFVKAVRATEGCKKNFGWTAKRIVDRVRDLTNVKPFGDGERHEAICFNKKNTISVPTSMNTTDLAEIYLHATVSTMLDLITFKLAEHVKHQQTISDRPLDFYIGTFAPKIKVNAFGFLTYQLKWSWVFVRKNNEGALSADQTWSEMTDTSHMDTISRSYPIFAADKNPSGACFGMSLPTTQSSSSPSCTPVAPNPWSQNNPRNIVTEEFVNHLVALKGFDPTFGYSAVSMSNRLSRMMNGVKPIPEGVEAVVLPCNGSSCIILNRKLNTPELVRDLLNGVAPYFFEGMICKLAHFGTQQKARNPNLQFDLYVGKMSAKMEINSVGNLQLVVRHDVVMEIELPKTPETTGSASASASASSAATSSSSSSSSETDSVSPITLISIKMKITPQDAPAAVTTNIAAAQ